MPSAGRVLDTLTWVTNGWVGLALGWHVAFAALQLALAWGWRPPRRALAGLLLLPLGSVSALAWAAGNPFNGLVFAALVGALALTLRHIPQRRVLMSPSPGVRPSPAIAAGLGLVAFGWVYPHFLQATAWWTYMYAAPLGVIPCPTLAAVGGVTIMAGGFGTRRWMTLLAGASFFYGLVGVVWLGVNLDIALLAAAVLLLWQGQALPHMRPVRVLDNVIL